MKTKILLVMFIFSGFVHAYAEEQYKKFNFGLKVAPAISWLNSNREEISSDGVVAKFNWGFIGIYNFTQNFSAVSGFNINSLGGKLKNEVDHTSYKYKYSEFELPVIFQMKSNEIVGIKIFFQLGIAPGVIMSAKNSDTKEKISKNLFDVSWLAATGVNVPVKGNIELFGQIKYNGGLTNIAKNDLEKAKASFVELGLGVLF